MMKKNTLILLLMLIAGTISSQILQVYEIEKINEKKPIESNSNIIDINARIEVSISKESLIKTVSISEGINQDMLNQLDKLNFVLANQIDILQSLDLDFNSLSHEEKIAELGKYSALMSDFYSRLRNKGNEEIKNSVEKHFSSYITKRNNNQIDVIAYPSPQVYVIKKVAEDAGKLLSSMGKSKDFEKIRFQLVASLNSKSGYPSKVHVENFDNYSEGEFYEVPRWVTTFSDEDIAVFEKTRDQADKLNTLVNYNLDNVSEMLKSNFSSIECFQNLIITIDTTIRNRISSIDDAQKKKEIEDFLNVLNFRILNAYEMLNELQSLNDGTNILQTFNSYQETISSAIKTLPETIETILTNNSVLITALPDDLVQIVDDVKTCNNKLSEDIESAVTIVKAVNELLNPFKKTADFADQVSNKVINFSMDNLPDHGYINLKTAGPRKNGDELVIRFKVLNEEESKNNLPGETVEMRIFELRQLSVYSISKVTLILAVPYANSDVELLDKNRVQFAPSGSLLFKFGSRKYRTWNYLDPGIGFNFSTPDFNLDGTPDIGMGIIGTVLKDIVSFGWSYNTNTDSQYWFVGLSIPVDLPGLPINSVKSNTIR